MLYHAVGAGSQALDITLFAQQMQWLNAHCNVMALTDLLNTPFDKKKIQVAISFDDGYACLYEHAAPILSKLNMPATVYINTGWMGESVEQRKSSDPSLGHYHDEAFLTWEEAHQLARQGWEIGSHGVNHLDFTKLSIAEAKKELAASKQAIEARLNNECAHFAYTWGRHTKSLRRDVVDNVGYRYAAAAHHASWTKKEDLLALPRMNIEKGYSMEDFKGIVLGKWDYLQWIHKVKGLL